MVQDDGPVVKEHRYALEALLICDGESVDSG